MYSFTNPSGLINFALTLICIMVFGGVFFSLALFFPRIAARPMEVQPLLDPRGGPSDGEAAPPGDQGYPPVPHLGMVRLHAGAVAEATESQPDEAKWEVLQVRAALLILADNYGPSCRS